MNFQHVGAILNRFTLIGCAVISAFCWIDSSAAFAEEPPNIILIMADDLGVEGLGCYGGQSYQTPNLDQMAQQGMRFTHAYSQPLCTNTRIQLMTGLYNNRNWMYFGILDPNAKTFGHYLRDAGYKTCIAGKWQLQSYDPPDYPGAALRRGSGMKVSQAGFDHYNAWHIGHTESKGSRYADPLVNENGRFVESTRGKYGPDLWVEFINEFVTASSQDDQPFFVYYSMALPHWPMVPTPNSKDWADPKLRHIEDTRHFKDMVEYMDQCVGKVVDHVDQLGLSKSTLILFYSDNGTHRKITSRTSTGDVVGGKGLTTDTGTHVPLIARWIGRVEAGSVNNELIDSTDFLPTLCEAAQEKVPAKDALDGISFYQQLFQNATNVRPWVFCHYDPRPGWDKDQFEQVRFVRNKRYKLYGDGSMFDLQSDQLEKTPLSQGQVQAVTSVHQKLKQVLDEMPNPEVPPRDPLHFRATKQQEILPEGTELELLWGQGKFTEGPVAIDEQTVLFTDIPRNRIMKFSEGETSVYLENSRSANGLMLDGQGNLIACEGANGGGRQLTLIRNDGKRETIANRWNGKAFNSPNDLALAPNGNVYFTDPRYGASEGRELDFEGVYLVRDGQIFLATKDVERPNGILISQDGKHAFVADNNNQYGGARTLLKFDIDPEGLFENRKILFDFGMGRRGVDGMALGADGNIYATAGKGRDAGVFVFGADGENLAKIDVPDNPTNCTFGKGRYANHLYITAQVATEDGGRRFGLYRVKLTMPQ